MTNTNNVDTNAKQNNAQDLYRVNNARHIVQDNGCNNFTPTVVLLPNCSSPGSDNNNSNSYKYTILSGNDKGNINDVNSCDTNIANSVNTKNNNN